MDEKVFVVKSELVTTEIITNNSSAKEALEKILKKGFFVNRSIAENNNRYKQIIPYSIFRYKNDILCYKRSKAGNEARLHNLYSIGIGGHINLIDSRGKLSPISILESARDREIEEEFSLTIYGQPNFLGFINDDTNMVGKVHLGIAYEWFLASKYVEAKEKSIEEYIYISIDDLLSTNLNLETWSTIVVNEFFHK